MLMHFLTTDYPQFINELQGLHKASKGGNEENISFGFKQNWDGFSYTFKDSNIVESEDEETTKGKGLNNEFAKLAATPTVPETTQEEQKVTERKPSFSLNAKEFRPKEPKKPVVKPREKPVQKDIGLTVIYVPPYTLTRADVKNFRPAFKI